jgi:hypothetical protein
MIISSSSSITSSKTASSKIKENKDLNAFYYYLDYKFESLLDEEKNRIQESKFDEFLNFNLPKIIAKNMLNYINKPDNKIKRKKYFIEMCFLLFSPSTVEKRDKEKLIYYIYYIFNFNKNKNKSKKDDLSIEKIILMTNSLLLTLLNRINETNYIIILTFLLRINEILKHCFLEKTNICAYEFCTCIKNNPLSLEIFEILFLCASPINYNLIGIIKRFLNEDDFNLKKNFYKLDPNKNKDRKKKMDIKRNNFSLNFFNKNNNNNNKESTEDIYSKLVNDNYNDKILEERDEPFLIKVLNFSEEEKTFDENYTDELSENDTNIDKLIYKHRLSTEKNVLNTKNLNNFLNTKVSGNLKFFRNVSGGNENILECFKFFSIDFSFDYEELCFFELSHKKYENKFEDIDNEKYFVLSNFINNNNNIKVYNSLYIFIELLNEKIDISDINKFSTKKLLLNLLEKCNENNISNNKALSKRNKREFKCYYKFKSEDKNNNNNNNIIENPNETNKDNNNDNDNDNWNSYTIRIIDKSFVFFKEEKLVKIIDISKFILKNDIQKSILDNNNNYDIDSKNNTIEFKGENNDIHLFKFIENNFNNNNNSFNITNEEEGLNSFIEIFKKETSKFKMPIRPKVKENDSKNNIIHLDNNDTNNNIKKNNKFDYLREDLKKELIINLNEKNLFNSKLFYDKEIREYVEANIINSILDKIIKIQSK